MIDCFHGGNGDRRAGFDDYISASGESQSPKARASSGVRPLFRVRLTARRQEYNQNRLRISVLGSGLGTDVNVELLQDLRLALDLLRSLGWALELPVPLTSPPRPGSCPCPKPRNPAGLLVAAAEAGSQHGFHVLVLRDVLAVAQTLRMLRLLAAATAAAAAAWGAVTAGGAIPTTLMGRDRGKEDEDGAAGVDVDDHLPPGLVAFAVVGSFLFLLQHAVSGGPVLQRKLAEDFTKPVDADVSHAVGRMTEEQQEGMEPGRRRTEEEE
ncbi:hypothetical protein EYF80_003484 [Liparis tanakae]|uniref:Uncharacterized protein n=1 Tax=Liparis tanakae TaxID=230148 RepID=A0A4Z2J7S2_9TELE|nr:hypothetical protein EYF80_003484 [Liparis tanakae]